MIPLSRLLPLLETPPVYISRKTGEIATLEFDEENKLKSSIHIENILESGEFVKIPELEEVDEFTLMEEFSRSIEHPDIQRHFFQHIRGKKAFSKFQESLRGFNLEKEWDEFYQDALMSFLADWCETEGLLQKVVVDDRSHFVE